MVFKRVHMLRKSKRAKAGGRPLSFFGQVRFVFVGGFLEVLNGLAQTTADLRQLAYAEEDKDYQKYYYKFGCAQAKHQSTSKVLFVSIL